MRLCPGADPELYNRIREAVSKIKAIADGDSKTFGIGAFCFLQENGITTLGGGDYTREGYKAKVRQLYSDVIADFCAGQRPPAMFTYQTGGTYTIDTYELAIGMAQLDMATEGGNIYGVCPSYPFPNKDSGHLTSNGYRWMDMFSARSCSGFWFLVRDGSRYIAQALKFRMIMLSLTMQFRIRHCSGDTI